MPRKQRVAKPLRARECEDWPDDPRAVKELLSRARWGGILSGLEPLTEAERRAWRRHQQAQPTWTPQRALRHAWDHVDSIHGSRPWDAQMFDVALDVDRQAIAEVLREHPAQQARLVRWQCEMEALGAERAADPLAGASYYQRLLSLGYRSPTAADRLDDMEASATLC
jgi:hypothetical protein